MFILCYLLKDIFRISRTLSSASHNGIFIRQSLLVSLIFCKCSRVYVRDYLRFIKGRRLFSHVTHTQHRYYIQLRCLSKFFGVTSETFHSKKFREVVYYNTHNQIITWNDIYIYISFYIIL